MKPLFLLISLYICVFVGATAYSPQTIPNPKTYCADCFVSNPDNIISPETEQKLNALLLSLYHKSEVEVAIVAVDEITASDYMEFAYDLFQTWNIGKAGKNLGLLILLVNNERAVKIETGYGLEGLLPDAVCEDILNNYIFPPFKQGDYDAGFMAGTQQIYNVLTSQEALEELLLEENKSESEALNILLSYIILAFWVLIIMIWMAYKVLNFNPHASNNVRYNHVGTFYAVSWIFVVLFPLPMLFFLIWLRKERKKIRNKPVKCGECGQLMTLLSEKEEDNYLDSGKQMEEKLRSINYDVWLCKSCLNHIILPYEYNLTQYSKCPQCGSKTYHLHSDVVRQNATQLTAGKGEKTYLCEHCGKKILKTYTIPKLPMVVVAGSGSSGRSRGAGGFSGGSWGGGFSGGGGAGGRF